MTQKSLFWTTNDTGDGPTAGYTAADFYDFLRRLLIPGGEASQGVLRGVENELAVSGTSSPLSMATGAAIVYGLFYENGAALNLTVATPITGLTGGRVNLKADWTAQTVRAVVQLNTDGTAAIPALVQTAGSEWSIPLATFTINQAGTITLTDAREWCQFANWLEASQIDAVAGLSVIGRASGSEGPAAEITAANDGEVLRRSGGALGFGQIDTAGIADGAVTADKLGVTGLPDFYKRQGGNSSDWSAAGTTDYTPSTVRMQAGIVSITIANGQYYNSAAITFPEAFSNKPLIFLSMTESSNFNGAAAADSVAAGGFTLLLNRPYSTGSLTVEVQWLAIGPE